MVRSGFIAPSAFVNLENWGKGQVYVNGYAVGRHWYIGPQQTLYVPGCWLKKGKNEVIVLDVMGPRGEKTIEGLQKPIIDKLNLDRPQTHRLEGQTIDLSGEKPALEGEFKAGNGWQAAREVSWLGFKPEWIRAVRAVTSAGLKITTTCFTSGQYFLMFSPKSAAI